MRVEQLDYELPEELIAQEPLPQRDAARLLCLDRQGTIEHRRIRELPELLPPSLVVLNDTRVIPARLLGRKPSGGRVELLLLERERRQAEGEVWKAWGRSSKPLRRGQEVTWAEGALQATVLAREADGTLRVWLRAEGTVEDAIARFGRMPLPPYIRRDAHARDAERYQTVFARTPGAVAAPTAGLHFTPELLQAMQARGHRVTYVTLHVGPGTFAPLRTESLQEHPMHSERYQISEAARAALAEAKEEGRPVLAVGTTVARTLEASAAADGTVQAGAGATSLFIYPPYRFRVVDALLTNFHLPRSTLLAMVMAFGGEDAVRRAYRAAVTERYRFFSYGDAMLLKGAS